ncbi:MAG TPA: alpha/beta hydrolase-fold protein [Gaiellaceae bacterium]|nr:alpha/beta hydrolase-fold protein [Gaiellaceae bacterium]
MGFSKHTIASDALRGNPLGDPSERDLWVWVPDEEGRRYPAVYVLHAHMRSAQSWFNVEPFARSYPEEIAALAPDAVVVLVDSWTSVGGSQWIDSHGIGRYGTYLREEVVPFVDGRFPTIPDAAHRGLQGKSSGGYGALVTALERPDLFSAAAAHAPDALFEVTNAHGFAAAARELCEHHGGSLAEFLRTFQGFHSQGDALLNELAVCALAFSDGELPFDPETAMLVPDVWDRWLAHDPARLAARHPDAVRALRGLWLDAGDADEYFLDLGALALRRAFIAAGLPQDVLRFELFSGGHRGLTWRYPLSLAFLVERLSITL